MTSLVAQTVKNLPAMRETQVRSLVGKIPWRREWLPTPVFLPRKSHGQRSLVLQSMGSHRLGHGWVTDTFLFTLCHDMDLLQGKIFHKVFFTNYIWVLELYLSTWIPVLFERQLGLATLQRQMSQTSCRQNCSINDRLLTIRQKHLWQRLLTIHQNSFPFLYGHTLLCRSKWPVTEFSPLKLPRSSHSQVWLIKASSSVICSTLPPLASMPMVTWKSWAEDGTPSNEI